LANRDFQVANSPFLDNWVWLKPRGLDRLMAAITPQSIRNYFEFLEECVTERKKQEESIVVSEKDNGRKDMFHFLFNAKDSATNAPFSHPELLSSANLLVTAGSDTTSTALCSLFFYLSRNERIYDKLANEIRQTFRTAEDIRAGPELVECQYMHACILEGLRMTPSGPSELLREVLSGGYEIDGTWYSSGTLVGTPSYPVHYHQENFGDPFVFRPERWIAEEERGSTAIEVAKLKEKFNPFSIGPGACPGKNLAMLEMKITLSHILYSNDFRRPPDDVLNRGGGQAKDGWLRNNSNHYQIIDAFLALRNGPMIQLRRRELL
jgi:cytochrome P450